MTYKVIQHALKLAKIGISKRLPQPLNIDELKLHQPKLIEDNTVATLIQGEGCGPELTSYVEEVFHSAKVPVLLDVHQIESKIPAQQEKNLENAISSINKTGIALTGYLDKYASDKIGHSMNIRIARNRSYHSVLDNRSEIDNIIIRSSRELSNFDYARKINHEPEAHTVDRFIENTEMVTRFAFELAGRENRTKLTTVHATSGDKDSDAISLYVTKKIAEQYPLITYTDVSLNEWLRQLAANPGQYDVLLLHNFHPIVEYDLSTWTEDTTVLTVRQRVGSHVVFEGMEKKFLKNPIPMISAAAHMLEEMGWHEHAQAIRLAIQATVCRDDVRPRELGGKFSGRSVADHIIQKLKLAKLGAASLPSTL